MGWMERHDGVPAQGEIIGVPAVLRARAERRFIIDNDNITAAQVISGPQFIMGGVDGATPLPGYGSVHPQISGAVLRNYSATGDPPNVHATAYYSYGDIDPISPEFYGQSGDWFEEADKLPLAQIETTISTYSVGGAPVEQQVKTWKFDSFDSIYTSRQHTISVNIGGLIGDAIAAMDRQNNRIHQIGSRYYRFKAGGYKEIRLGVWVVNYHWFYESGTLYDSSLDAYYTPTSPMRIPPPIVGAAAADPAHPGAVTILGDAGEQYLRLPFHKRLIVPNPSGNPSDPPLFPHFLPYRVDANGHQELIGL